MSRFWQHFITNGGETPASPTPPPQQPSDGEALDAFSRVVVTVAEKLRPAVVNLRVGQGMRLAQACYLHRTVFYSQIIMSCREVRKFACG